MDYSKKFLTKKIPVKLFYLAKLLAFFNTTTLYAKNPIETIHSNELVGDYSHALRIARLNYHKSLELNADKETIAYLQEVKRLEKEVLIYGSSKLLFDENEHPREKLLCLLNHLGMKVTKQTALFEINEWAQANLLRQGERWEVQSKKFEGLRHALEPLLADLGFVHASQPNFDTYQGALVHGALLARVRLRIAYLVEKWKQGVRFKDLYFLTGERPLIEPYENREAFLQDEDFLLKIRSDWKAPVIYPSTESGMVQLIWEQSEIPQNMRDETNVYFIKAPMKKLPGSEVLSRPDTEDTVAAWLQTSPVQGRYLAITNAPYTNRQDLVIRTLAPNTYLFDTVGSAASPCERMAIFLDECARYLFQLVLFFRAEHKEG